MALPNISMTVRDGGLGIVPAGSAKQHVKIGPCLNGTAYVLYNYSDPADLAVALGTCKTVEAAAFAMNQGASPVSVMPTAWAHGNTGATTHGGTGLATVTAAEAPWAQITITITKTGLPGTGEFTYKVGSGTTSASIVIPSGGGGVYRVPGTFTDVTFTSMSFTNTDVYIIATTGIITKGGVASSDITQQSSPVDDYQVTVKIITAGALGTATFQYSLESLSGEAGAEKAGWSPVITTPSGSTPQVYAIGGTGVALSFATASGNFVADDTYDFNAAAPYITTTEQLAAMNALKVLSTDCGFVHVVNNWYLAAGAATALTSLDTSMTACETLYKYTFGILECPTSGSLSINPSGGALEVNAEADANTISAFASSLSNRVMVAAGDALLTSALDSKRRRRNAAWSIAARCATIPISEHPGEVGEGGSKALGGISWLYRDEQQTQGLDVARFATLRTIQGLTGYFVTRGMMMAQTTSDYTQVQRRRIMDEACRITRLALVPYLNKKLRIDSTTGHIDNRDARQIEETCNAKLESGLNIGQEDFDASAAAVAISRTNNILATSELIASVAVVPPGYAEAITCTIGFAATL